MRVLLFFISTYGYTSLEVRNFSFNKRLSWIFTFSAQILLFYIASLLGFLYSFMIITFFIGVILAIYQLYKLFQKYNNQLSFELFVEKIDWAAIIILILFIVYGYIITQHAHFNSYDDYSHWGLIVKYLFTEQALPDAATSIIRFNTYPVGTALFINYFINIVGYSVGNILLGQLVLVWSALYGILGIVKSKKRLLLILLTVIVFGILTRFTSTRPDNLLVDSLMPIVSLASIAGLWVYRNQLKLLNLNTIIISGALILFKNSAIYFVIVPLLLYIFILYKNHSELTWIQKSKNIVFTIVFSLIPLILWQIHTSQTFSNEDTGKHTMSLSSYKEEILNKDPEVIETIINNFVKRATNMEVLPTQGLLLIVGLFIISGIIFKYILKQKQYFFSLGIFTIGMIVLYYVGILLMYLFSMPTGEAVRLATFDRYALSAIMLGIGIYGITLVISIQKLFEVEKYKWLKMKSIYALLGVILSVIAIGLYREEINVLAGRVHPYDFDVPSTYEELADENFDLTDTPYVAVYSQNSNAETYYTGYVGEYHLYSSFVAGRNNFTDNLQEFDEKIHQYEYIVMLQSNDQFINKIEELYGYTINGPGIYLVKEISENNS